MTRSLLTSLFAFALVALPAQAALSISQAEAVNVTASSFSLFWRASDAALPSVQVFADQAGTVSLAGVVGVELMPLHSGDHHLPEGYAGRQARRSLQQKLEANGLLLAKVTGCLPDTVYYVRVGATAGEESVSFEGMISVRTAKEVAFAPEARRIEVEFESEQFNGLVATLHAEGAAFPLATVVGDGVGSAKAFFDLTALVDPVTGSNLLPSGELKFVVELHQQDVELEPTEGTLAFGEGFVVARTLSMPFTLPPESVAYFQFSPIAAQRAGVPFQVTITARREDGSVAERFAGRVDLASMARMDEGAGATPSFVAGVLNGLPVTIGTTGLVRLEARGRGIEAVGESEPFEVSTDLNSWLAAYFTPEELEDPEISGLLADPGGYGVPNLMRYAFGMNPRKPDLRGFKNPNVVEQGGEAYLALGFRRQQVAPDLLYVVEGSSNLSNWSIVDVLKPGEPEWVQVKDSAPIGSTAKRFMRVRVVTEYTYAAWQLYAFSDGDRANPSISSPSADPGNFGISNLLRYAFGLDPQAPSASGLPTVGEQLVDGERHLSIFFRRLAQARDLEYVVEARSGEGSWQALAVYSPGRPRGIQVVDTEPDVPAGSRSIRVRVVLLQD
jgi:hypothetical protein